MLLINQITNDASQQLTLTGINGIQIAMTLKFNPRTAQWIMGVDDGTTSIQGVAITASPNMLRQWKNIIAYGITCISQSGLDPYQNTSFSNENCQLFLLDSTDVATMETDWFT